MLPNTLQNVINMPFWDNEFLGNVAGDYAVALLAFLGLLALLKVFQWLVLKRLSKVAERTETDVDDALIRIVKSIRPPFYSFIALYLALRFIALHDTVNRLIDIVLIVWVVYQTVNTLQVLIDYILDRLKTKEEANAPTDLSVGQQPSHDSQISSARTAAQLLGRITKGVLWVVAALLILSNFGVNITSLIAGLGIGGVAVALAAQNILGDLFSSFVIYFDKPFVVGDFIVVGDKVGTVRKIGIKTTRVQALHGEELVFSNQWLTSAQVQNFKKMQKRRAVVTFGVEYETPPEKLSKIPDIVETIVSKQENIKFDRSFFKEFSASAINFELVYFVESSDYNFYAKKNQEIALAINKQLQDAGISMAYPTQVVYLKK